jgi:pyruvate,water dikinase
LAGRLRSEIFPRFLSEVQAARNESLANLSGQQLLDRLNKWTTRTLDELARWSLRPAVLAADALDAMEKRLARSTGVERAGAAARSLLSGVRPDPEADLAADLQALGKGSLSQQEFLSRHGHRGPQEMELAAPRWREDPSLLLCTIQPSGTPVASERGEDPVHSSSSVGLDRARTYMALRETGKHYLMLGYEVIRQTLLELGRRHKLADDIFYLEPDELPQLIAGNDLSDLAAQRRKHRQMLLSLEIPPVLFSDDLAAIGRPAPIAGATQLQGTPVSAGVAEGPALVLEQPVPPADLPADFILVCPSTDPAWVPLFLQARGLVMETGGVLSHGAIVAREFGIPAVVGIGLALSQIQTGQRLRVDGNSGNVYLLG